MRLQRGRGTIHVVVCFPLWPFFKRLQYTSNMGETSPRAVQASRCCRRLMATVWPKHGRDIFDYYVGFALKPSFRGLQRGFNVGRYVFEDYAGIALNI